MWSAASEDDWMIHFHCDFWYFQLFISYIKTSEKKNVSSKKNIFFLNFQLLSSTSIILLFAIIFSGLIFRVVRRFPLIVSIKFEKKVEKRCTLYQAFSTISDHQKLTFFQILLLNYIKSEIYIVVDIFNLLFSERSERFSK